VSSNGYSPMPAAPLEGSWFEDVVPIRHRRKHRYWLHLLLLLLTFLTTTIVGSGLARSFAASRPFDFEIDFQGYSAMWRDPAYLLAGLPFSLTLLGILMAHEMGHFLTARYYGVDASLPFFIPAPTLIGTLGAFIRIRSAILSKRVLFDIGVAGPLAGFAVLLVPLIVGVNLSYVKPGIADSGELIFGTPLILRFLEWIWFPGAAPGDIYLHPIARAAWVGVLATALNLLPIGQLDGGHILYAFAGERTRILSRVFVAALASLGTFQLFTTEYKAGFTWLIWSVILLIVAMRHPTIIDPVPVGRARTWLGLLALLLLILSFTPVPVRPSGL
jgi:membrane-associated protease RseP (regulator of RpoE activity)